MFFFFWDKWFDDEDKHSATVGPSGSWMGKDDREKSGDYHAGHRDGDRHSDKRDRREKGSFGGFFGD